MAKFLVETDDDYSTSLFSMNSNFPHGMIQPILDVRELSPLEGGLIHPLLHSGRPSGTLDRQRVCKEGFAEW